MALQIHWRPDGEATDSGRQTRGTAPTASTSTGNSAWRSGRRGRTKTQRDSRPGRCGRDVKRAVVGLNLKVTVRIELSGDQAPPDHVIEKGPSNSFQRVGRYSTSLVSAVLLLLSASGYAFIAD
jgi:hypothetical protein